MPKSPPKLDPATEAVVRRMLATPPQPKVGVKPVGKKKPVKTGKQPTR